MPVHELSTLELAPRHLQLVQALLRQHTPGAEVWAYGSRVTGGAQACSDLDLVLRQPGALDQAVPGWASLVGALQDSLLPISVDVHQWSQLPPAFQRNIEAGYVVLQS